MAEEYTTTTTTTTTAEEYTTIFRGVDTGLYIDSDRLSDVEKLIIRSPDIEKDLLLSKKITPKETPVEKLMVQLYIAGAHNYPSEDEAPNELISKYVLAIGLLQSFGWKLPHLVTPDGSKLSHFIHSREWIEIVWDLSIEEKFAMLRNFDIQTNALLGRFLVGC